MKKETPHSEYWSEVSTRLGASNHVLLLSQNNIKEAWIYAVYVNTQVGDGVSCDTQPRERKGMTSQVH